MPIPVLRAKHIVVVRRVILMQTWNFASRIADAHWVGAKVCNPFPVRMISDPGVRSRARPADPTTRDAGSGFAARRSR